MIGDSFIGIPFTPLGRSFKGVDCWGLVQLYYRDVFNIELPSYCNGYDEALEHNTISQLINEEKEQDWFRVPLEEVKHGDVLYYVMTGAPHVAIVRSYEIMLHIYVGGYSTLDKFRSKAILNRLQSPPHGAYRYKDLQ